MRVDLHDDGVLWMINRTVFHPMGFALAVDEAGRFTIRGDGTEVWAFTPENDDEKFEQFQALLQRLRALAL